MINDFYTLIQQNDLYYEDDTTTDEYPSSLQI